MGVLVSIVHLRLAYLFLCAVVGLAGIPSEPGKPTVDCVDVEATIQWAEPKTDGGSPIQGYHIYIREVESSYWKKLTKSLVTVRKYVCLNLVSGKTYEVQITATNDAGESKASPPSDEFTPQAKKKGKDAWLQ